MKDLNTGRRIKSINYKGLIGLFLIIGFILGLAGNSDITYGIKFHSNSQIMETSVDESFKEINENINEQSKLENGTKNYFPILKLYDDKDHDATTSRTNMDNFSFQSFQMLYYGKDAVKNQFKINKKVKAHREYTSKIFDKTRYESGAKSFLVDYEENDPYIQNIAYNITMNLENPTRAEIARAVYNWVQENVDYEYPAYYESKHFATQTAKLKKGNCCDQARLVIALCRAAGIPRYATEFDQSDSVQLMGGRITGHVWPVIITESGERIICDTTCNSNSFGTPSWKNFGYVKESNILTF